MLNKLNGGFFKSVSTFTIANALNAAIPFLLLPLLTKYLSPREFGIVSMFQVILNFMLPFSGFNIESTVSRYYFKKEEINFKSFITNGIYLVIGGTVLLIIVSLVFSNYILNLTFSEEAGNISSLWLVLTALIASLTNIFQIQSVLWQVQRKSVNYGIMRISKTILEISLSLILIVFVTANWQNRMLAIIISAFVFACIAIYFLFKEGQLELKLNKVYIKQALLFGAPLIPHVLSGVIITFSDRIFITNMISIEESGLYSVGYQVGMILSLFQSSFNQAWVPWFYEKLKQNIYSVKIKIVKFTYLYFILMLVLVLLLSIGTPLIFKLFVGSSFESASKYVFWIALGFAFNGMYKMVVNYLFYIEKTGLISMITVFIALLNITLNYVLIKMNGALGSAQATAISFLVEFIIIWLVSAKYYPMPWKLRSK